MKRDEVVTILNKIDEIDSALELCNPIFDSDILYSLNGDRSDLIKKLSIYLSTATYWGDFDK